jgi:hypothetical protein
MTWYAVIDASDNLISTGETVADTATLSAAGYTALTLAADPTGQVWNPSTQTFSAPPAPQNSYPTWTWLQRFTPAEIAAIRASTDQQVQAFLFMLQFTETVTPLDPVIQGGLEYVGSLGLLTAPRVAIIGVN